MLADGKIKKITSKEKIVREKSDVLVVAGCGIHNSEDNKSQHDGIHEFFIRKGARMKYIEKHYGQGEGNGKKILNPKTIINVEEGRIVELEGMPFWPFSNIPSTIVSPS